MNSFRFFFQTNCFIIIQLNKIIRLKLSTIRTKFKWRNNFKNIYMYIYFYKWYKKYDYDGRGIGSWGYSQNHKNHIRRRSPNQQRVNQWVTVTKSLKNLIKAVPFFNKLIWIFSNQLSRFIDNLGSQTRVIFFLNRLTENFYQI